MLLAADNLENLRLDSSVIIPLALAEVAETVTVKGDDDTPNGTTSPYPYHDQPVSF